ncbi:hypothetical protein PIIN_08927 [Serendipita indica DSM 11827]|uniref:Uncharacterized protein n=1 Tax=Serendipita indica (strain DSM 11827) TaxID=1109443 RepID=G4TUF4_SERID|nr:hypothetical protein PIIN_08927 [Serendipita indica DSM 11827]
MISYTLYQYQCFSPRRYKYGEGHTEIMDPAAFYAVLEALPGKP